jgi:DNA-binding NarL/FixJ family response regulator
LFLSKGTVRNYVSGIFTKLGVTDRTQAAVIALRHGLVD